MLPDFPGSCRVLFNSLEKRLSRPPKSLSRWHKTQGVDTHIICSSSSRATNLSKRVWSPICSERTAPTDVSSPPSCTIHASHGPGQATGACTGLARLLDCCSFLTRLPILCGMDATLS